VAQARELGTYGGITERANNSPIELGDDRLRRFHHMPSHNAIGSWGVPASTRQRDAGKARANRADGARSSQSGNTVHR
jgi:hypothetical protein